MAKPASRITQTFADYGSEANPFGEVSSVSLPVTTLTAGNYAAQQALHATLFIAIDAVSKGTEIKRETMAASVIQGTGPSADPYAQRENKWLCRYHDSVNDDKYTFEIPCADLTLLGTNSEMIDETNAAWTDLKAAFEAVVKSPNNDNAVVLDSAQFVGRNL
jgi:hypothetical protein